VPCYWDRARYLTLWNRLDRRAVGVLQERVFPAQIRHSDAARSGSFGRRWRERGRAVRRSDGEEVEAYEADTDQGGSGGHGHAEASNGRGRRVSGERPLDWRWAALHILTGEVGAWRVLADGFDDLTCESSAPQQAQVRSRQERVGDLRTAQVAWFVVQGWSGACSGSRPMPTSPPW